jgi:hypothetical protein
MDYQVKYLKYKKKYQNLINKIGGKCDPNVYRQPIRDNYFDQIYVPVYQPRDATKSEQIKASQCDLEEEIRKYESSIESYERKLKKELENQANLLEIKEKDTMKMISDIIRNNTIEDKDKDILISNANDQLYKFQDNIILNQTTIRTKYNNLIKELNENIKITKDKIIDEERKLSLITPDAEEENMEKVIRDQNNANGIGPNKNYKQYNVNHRGEWVLHE